MASHAFRIVNVFTVGSDPLSGNPLCVFEDARDLSDAQMQALALQFNLSETTFVLPSDAASARVRIFTPTFEMPFAGHPTLGTAYVVNELRALSGDVRLQMTAGVIPVVADGDRWTLRARAPASRPPQAGRTELARTLGLEPSDLGERPLWVNTGVDQLVIPLTSEDAVARARPDARELERHASRDGKGFAYVWAGAGADIAARFFFTQGAAVIEDPATGSACANLGGWLIETGAKLPCERRIRQGERVGRPSLLHLRVDAARNIYVSGRVLELARGTLTL